MTTATKRGRRSAAAGAALALSLTLAACGGGGGEQEGPAAGSAGQTESAPSAVGPVIEMADLRFEPRELTVRRGETVTFRNVGEVTHNAKGKDFFARVVEPGGSYRRRFNQTGSFDYVCTFHPGMEGTLVVK